MQSRIELRFFAYKELQLCNKRAIWSPKTKLSQEKMDMMEMEL